MCYGNLRDKLTIKHKKIVRQSNNEKREFSTIPGLMILKEWKTCGIVVKNGVKSLY